MPDQIQVYAETVDGGDKVLYCTDDIPVTDARVLISISDSNSLKAYRKYNAIIVAKNVFGESNSTREIPFSKCVTVSVLRSCICVTIVQLLPHPPH